MSFANWRTAWRGTVVIATRGRKLGSGKQDRRPAKGRSLRKSFGTVVGVKSPRFLLAQGAICHSVVRASITTIAWKSMDEWCIQVGSSQGSTGSSDPCRSFIGSWSSTASVVVGPDLGIVSPVTSELVSCRGPSWMQQYHSDWEFPQCEQCRGRRCAYCRKSVWTECSVCSVHLCKRLRCGIQHEFECAPLGEWTGPTAPSSPRGGLEEVCKTWRRCDDCGKRTPRRCTNLNGCEQPVCPWCQEHRHDCFGFVHTGYDD